MERLTKRLADGQSVMDCKPCELPEKYCTALTCRQRLKVRLAAIEDILGDEYDLDHLRDLVQAEQDGRLVMLPCKVGSTVYRIYDDCDFPGDCHTQRMCKGCEYRNLFIEEQAFCLSMLSQNGMLEHPYYMTRAEAEAALKRGTNETDPV